MSDAEHSTATCKTCGGISPNHVTSMFDPNGIGHPGHRMDEPTHQAEAKPQNPYICCVCHSTYEQHCDDCKDLCLGGAKPVDSKLHDSVGFKVDGDIREVLYQMWRCGRDGDDRYIAAGLGEQIIATRFQIAVQDKNDEILKLRADIAYAIGRFQSMEMDSAYLEQEYPEWRKWEQQLREEKE